MFRLSSFVCKRYAERFYLFINTLNINILDQTQYALNKELSLIEKLSGYPESLLTFSKALHVTKRKKYYPYECIFGYITKGE